jgi:hypothetical protein
MKMERQPRLLVKLLLVLVSLLVAGNTAAQETIVTDRPGLGFSPAVVPPGVFQVELGIPAFNLTEAGAVSTRLINFPALVRVGVVNSLELRLGSTLYNSSRIEIGPNEETTSGFGTVEVGAKFGGSFGDGGVTAAIIPSVILPIGGDNFSSDRTAFTTNGVASFPLPSSMAFNANAGVAFYPVGDEDFTTVGALVGVLSRTLSSTVGGYVEGAFFPTSDADDPAYIGGGLTYLATNLVQIDAFVDRGLTDVSTDWIFGAGFSLRVP